MWNSYMRESAVASNFIRSKAEAPHRKTPIFTTATCDALFSTFVICHFCWRTVQLSLYLSLLSRSLASLLFLRTIRRRRRRRQQQRQRCVCMSLVNSVLCLRFSYTNPFVRDSVSARAFALIWFDCVTVSKFILITCPQQAAEQARLLSYACLRFTVCV